ncbi:hypothetical protein [Xenorhabdus sp. KK7.4]|uniref:hypothetical protein n=1 Tax=Xenorhabdus sp. KK7.4 TaxID=1851572 RepID=UPI000C051F6D|nr:hypothetical protein [Xenorhabdus sp. KK7.4]
MNKLQQLTTFLRENLPELTGKTEFTSEMGEIRFIQAQRDLGLGQYQMFIKPGEQLQQQRAEVSQRVTQEGSWIRQTDQTINESSMHREIKADTETRTVITRDTTIQATDKTLVLGTSTLLAGAVQQVAEGDYSLATSSNYLASVGKNASIDVGQTLIEKIGLLKQSIAGVKQKIVAPVV